MTQKVMLMILDGWGSAPNPEVSAVDLAQTPNIDALFKKYSHASLLTDGEKVGLPNGQMGNSEVGHMNLELEELFTKIWLKYQKPLKTKLLKRIQVLVRGF